MINNLVKLTGGVGDHTTTDKVDPTQLSLGVQVEMEHTNDPDIAKEIAMDHLTEDPDYYSKLIKAGLATEFQPSHNSGFGDPDQSFNDVPRVGKGGLKKGNMHGTIGNTSNGQVSGRNSEPIIKKNLMRVNETATIDHLQNFDGYYEFTSKIDNKTYEIDFHNGQIKSIEDLEDKTKEFDLEKANKLFAAKTKLSNIINMSSIEPKNLEEKTGKKKPKPTNPALWARAKAAARAKFDVYPSAYANGWAAKWYKSKGGGWRMSECSGTTECDCGCSESVVGQIFDTPDAGAIAQGGVGGGISSTAGSGYDFVGYAENKDTIIKEQRLKAVIKNLVREVLSEIKDVSGTKDEAKGKKWIQKAIHPGKKGALKKALGVKAGEKIPLEKLKTAAKQGGKVGQRARLALTLRKLK